MREFRIYDINAEMPAAIDGQIYIPKFMLSERRKKVKSGSKPEVIKTMIEGASIAALCWFFMAMDAFPVVSYIGMPLSLAALIVTERRGKKNAIH